MKTLIIAEAGVNHNGDFDMAIELINLAKKAGADIVKFQTSITSTSKYSEKAEYQKRETGANESQLDMISKLRFSFDQHRALKEYCDKIGIQYLSTPFDFESIVFLESMNPDFWKVPSGEIINIPYLRRIGQTKRPVVMSTGMGTIEEIENAIKILKENGTPKITLLQCTTEYPAKFEDVNLRAMLSLQERFGVEVGLSDHTPGIEASVAAVALGAKVIEKHFTLDKSLPGPDHKASLAPEELINLVSSIRNVERAIGDGNKIPKEGEIENMHAARKSIVALRDIKKGEVFTEDNLVPRHAGKGISPAKWDEVLGRIAIRDFREDEMIEI